MCAARFNEETWGRGSQGCGGTRGFVLPPERTRCQDTTDDPTTFQPASGSPALRPSASNETRSTGACQMSHASPGRAHLSEVLGSVSPILDVWTDVARPSLGQHARMEQDDGVRAAPAAAGVVADRAMAADGARGGVRRPGVALRRGAAGRAGRQAELEFRGAEATNGRAGAVASALRRRRVPAGLGRGPRRVQARLPPALGRPAPRRRGGGRRERGQGPAPGLLLLGPGRRRRRRRRGATGPRWRRRSRACPTTSAPSSRASRPAPPPRAARSRT